MKKFLLLALALVCVSVLSAQTKPGLVRGKLVDSVYKESLSDASITITNLKDSTSAGFALASAGGDFQISNLDTGTFRMVITFKGYATINRRITIKSESPALNLGNINMDKATTVLSEVIVEAAPISVKKDTVEFRAGAFKTVPNATAEDLFKKLPGVDVDKDGNVKAQGEDIQKVYVDGKEFFGTDPKLATKNITADMIESVQVFDDMSDQAKFTRIDDGSRAKTINIRLKKEQRKGYLTKFVGGYGTDDRYNAGINAFSFKADRRISLIASSNNINKSTFSFNDIVTSMGGFGAAGGGGGGNFGGGGGNRGGGGGFGGGNRATFGSNQGSNGITTATSVGLNYTNKFSNKLELTGSYFFSNTETHTQQNSQRTTTFPRDSITVRDAVSTSSNKNQNHRVNLRLEYTIDSMNSFLYTPSVVFQHSNRFSLDSSTTRIYHGDVNGKGYRGVQGKTENDNTRDGVNINNNVLFRHKFHTAGRTLTLGWNNSINNSDGKGSTLAPLLYYNSADSVVGNQNQNLINTQKTRANNNIASLSYTEPLGRNKLLELNYAYTNNHSTSDRDAFNFDSLTNKYDLINRTQTNSFTNDYISHRYGTNFRVQAEKYNYQLGIGVQTAIQKNENTRPIGANGEDKTINTRQNFTNLFPTANFTYNFSRSKNLRFFYRGRTNQPTITQLQDAPDVTDPTAIRNGNPNLKQEFSNSINLNYSSFNPVSFKFLNANINLGQTSNNIVNNIDSLGKRRILGVDSTLSGKVQYIVPVNVNGNVNANSYITLGIPLKGKMKGTVLNFNNNINFSRDPGVIYNREYNTNTFSISQSAGGSLNLQDKLNVTLTARLGYNNVTYTGDATLSTNGTSNNNFRNQKYTTQTYSTNINYYIVKTLILATDFDLVKNNGLGGVYDEAIPLWNVSLAQLLFKKKNGELRFSVNDLFNQNKSIARSNQSNYIENTRTVVLKRYFMLTFTYSLNRLGSQRGNNQQFPGRRDGMPPGGGRFNRGGGDGFRGQGGGGFGGGQQQDL